MSYEGTDINKFDFLSAIAPKKKLFEESYFKGDDLKINFILNCQALKF